MASDQPTDSPTDGQELHGGALHDAHSRGGIRLRRWVVPGLIVLFWLFVVGPLGSFAGQLSDVQENDAAGFLPASAESTQVRELSQGFSTSDTLPAIVVYEFTEHDRPGGPGRGLRRHEADRHSARGDGAGRRTDPQRGPDGGHGHRQPAAGPG